MGFLAPGFLIGAAAVGLPLYLHLLRRHTTTPQPFSSLMFFEPRTQSSIRHRRLRYLLLLSLRLAVLISLALAFANPYINRTTVVASSDKLLLVVIDDSFSMRAGSRLSDAKREALSVLDLRRGAERAQVAVLGSQLHVLTQPIQDSTALRAAVESIGPSDSRASFAELTRVIRSLSESTRALIEVHLFSDMQKSAMPADFAELALPSRVALVLHSVVKSTQPNWVVESVNAPGTVWDPGKARVEAVVAGYQTAAAVRKVSLVVNGKRIASQDVEVPAGGRASTEFQSLDVPYGFSRCEVRIDSADALPADDTYRFAVERSDPQPVLFVHEPGDSRSPLYFGAALAAAVGSSFTFEAATTNRATGVPLSRYAFVVISDVVSLPSQLENNLLQYVRAGGGVLIAAGTSTSHRSEIPVSKNRILATRDYAQDGARFLTVGEIDSSHPSTENNKHWADVKVYYAVEVDPAGSRVLARLTDQTPLLLDDQIGEGHVLLFTSGLDDLTNDLPVQPIFVPFVKQSARFLSDTADRSGSRQVDSFLKLRATNEQAVSVEIVDPAGRRPLSLQQSTSAESYQLASSGFYDVHLANGRRDVIGVNADRRESNLEIVPDDVLALWRGSDNTVPSQSAALAAESERAKPYRLWWYAMVLVLAAAIAESLVAARYLATQREEP
ncbi:MAG TPA: BatA and WFA domain-containing protein [Candidatus Polarisedimenticolia bacterium]|nr:BatA and WFA domain-containing protein [Candidatus Polarisedimenticolia bacterium]